MRWGRECSEKKPGTSSVLSRQLWGGKSIVNGIKEGNDGGRKGKEEVSSEKDKGKERRALSGAIRILQ